MNRHELFLVMRSMHPFWSAMAAGITAQLLKPLFYYMKKKKWNWLLVKASGGFPSSHSALVTALALAVGLQEHFRSSIFAVTLTMAVIVIYDAANVRYYSGQNIKVTQQLVRDLQEQQPEQFDDPIYQLKMKDVLGHKWIEIIGGIAIGVLYAILFWRIL